MVTLEEVYLVLQVVWSIVLWCGREKTDVRIKSCIAAYLSYEVVEGNIHISISIAELVALVDNDQTIILIG